MFYQRLADLVVVLHALFVLFVLFGGLLVLRRPRLAWIHVPCALWGVLIEFAGWYCPLTPLEVALRERGGAAGYVGGFIAHYLEGVLYPAGLTPKLQVWFGTLALVLNLAIYWRVARRARRANR
jgi:hypothetical protein